ncbi:MAG: HDIG domain-containing protein, partial [bacterium]|nr:HDIG domain-containing protein [bacterium]
MADGKGEPSRDFGVATHGLAWPEKLARLEAVGATRAWIGLELLGELGLLRYIVPEQEEGIGVTQNKHHVYTVGEHNARALDFAARNHWSLAVRLGALFHDIAKPRCKVGEGPDSTFYNHDVVGAKMAYQILSRLRYPEKFIDIVTRLIRWHLFRYDYEGDEVETTDSAIRRLIRNVGEENIQ